MIVQIVLLRPVIVLVGYVPEFHNWGGLFFDELNDLLRLSDLSKTENLRQVHHGRPQVFSTFSFQLRMLIRSWKRASLQICANIIFLLSGGHSHWKSCYQALCRKSSGMNGEELAVPFVNNLFMITLIKAREWQSCRGDVWNKTAIQLRSLISWFCQYIISDVSSSTRLSCLQRTTSAPVFIAFQRFVCYRSAGFRHQDAYIWHGIYWGKG